MLKQAEAQGEIRLKYLDESGLCLWSGVGYGWSRRGEQKRLVQTQRRGRRLNILGLWQPQQGFDYALSLGSWTAATYLQVMEWQAQQAEQVWRTTGQITVVVLDNYSLHKSKAVRQQWPEWEAKGLYLFFLPSYSSEMNRIEEEWHQLKAYEIAGRMFEDELALTDAVVAGMQARGDKGTYHVERFIFSYA